MTHLHGRGAARCTGREFSFHRREQALDQGAAAVNPLREGAPHLGAHSTDAPSFLAALGGDYASRSKLLADVGVLPLAPQIRRRPAPARCEFAGKPFRRRWGDLRRRSTDPVARSATTGTSDPSRPPRPTSTNAATEAVFAGEDACAAQRTCSAHLAPNRWRALRRAPAFAPGAANRATDARFRR